jgi:Mor family transcriptional regulator
MVINAVKPKVNTTKLGKATSELKKLIQKNKGSKAKLDQTIFEMNNPKFKGKEFTFAPKGKAIKESDRQKQIIKDNNKVIGRMFKKALKGDK